MFDPLLRTSLSADDRRVVFRGFLAIVDFALWALDEIEASGDRPGRGPVFRRRLQEERGEFEHARRVCREQLALCDLDAATELHADDYQRSAAAPS